MFMRVKLPLLLITLCMILLLGNQKLSVFSETVHAEYISPEGIHYTSFSKEWTSRNKLMALHQELLKNTHGEELYALQSIMIYPDVRTRNLNDLGSYTLSYRLGSNNRYEILNDSKISLFGGNTVTSIDEMAVVLAKEYGKHFTQYHILKNENIVLTRTGSLSKYASIRHLQSYDKFLNASQSIWRIEEIAANDYVQLFSSPLVRKHHAFPNMIEDFEKNPMSWNQPVTSRFMYNLVPQENLDIPLAFEVEGLREYFINLSGVQVADPIGKNIDKPRLYIKELQQVTNQRNSLMLTFAWDTVSNNRQPLHYTLVTNTENDLFAFPIVTYENIMNRGQTLLGKYGAAVSRMNNTIYFNKHIGFYGKKTFRVYVSDRQGNLISSNEIVIDLSQTPIRILDNSISYKDVSMNHWAFQDLKIASALGIIQGYTDETFKPNQFVSKSEFLIMLNRVYQLANTTTGTVDTHLSQLHDFITREEVAMLTSHVLKLNGYTRIQTNKGNFIDNQHSTYADDLRLVASYNIMQGFPDRSFRPKEYLTRAQAVVVTNQLFHTIRAN